MADVNRVQSLPHDNGDDRIIIQSFMKELCRRDEQDNRAIDKHPNRTLNVFPVQEIQQKVLAGYGLERVKLVLRRYILEKR